LCRFRFVRRADCQGIGENRPASSGRRSFGLRTCAVEDDENDALFIQMALKKAEVVKPPRMDGLVTIAKCIKEFWLKQNQPAGIFSDVI